MTRTLGAWDCSYCKTKKILGNVFDCPGCGYPRPRGVRFYQIPNAPIVTPKIAAQLGSGDPNWYCTYCDSGNKDVNQKCWNCGAERGDAPSHEVKKYLQDEAVPQSTEEAEASDPDGKSWVEEPKVPVVPVPVSTDSEDSSYEESSNSEGAGIQSSNNTEPGKIKPFAIGALAIIGIAVVSFFIYQLFFNTHEEIVRVNGFNWTQGVTVQEYRTVRESSWSTTPLGAYNIYSDYRNTGRDEKIHDGWKTVDYPSTCTDSKYVSATCRSTTDNGDGSFSTSTYECGGYEPYTYSCTESRPEELYHYEDIYDWYYEYNIDKWVSIANYATSGNDHNPYFFSDFVLNDPYDGHSTPRLGQQQQFQIPGDYSVTFFCDNHKVGDKGYFTRKYSQSDWVLFKYETDYSIKVNFFNGILSFPTPQNFSFNTPLTGSVFLRIKYAPCLKGAITIFFVSGRVQPAWFRLGVKMPEASEVDLGPYLSLLIYGQGDFMRRRWMIGARHTGSFRAGSLLYTASIPKIYANQSPFREPV